MFPKVNPVVPTNRASRRQVSRSLNLTQKLVLTLSVVVLATISIWMASVRVHSAPRSAANPPAAAPVPEVKLVDVPAEALIGEKFKFKITFDNIGTAVGFGPFIDVVLPAGGMDLDSLNPSTTIHGPCDGISTNLNGSLVSVNGGPIPVTTYNTLTTPCSTNGSPITHAYSGSGVSPVSVPPGGQLITLQLPFGSFEPNQPKIEIELTVDLHKFADAGAPNLTIYTRGGFRFGMTPLNEATDQPILTDAGPSNTWLEKKDVIPTVFTLKKAVNAPEDETATGPNFLRKYTIIADIANGQQLDNLKVQDFLHNNVQYQGGVVVKIGTTTATGGTCPGVDYELTQQPPTSAAQNSPNSDLEVSFCHPISGTSAAADVTITFAFFIPEQNANNTMVLPTNCKPATSINDVKAEADWTPADPRDVPMVHISSDLTTQDHVLKDKCLAIQKSVAIINDTGAPGLTPNDTLLYTLKFQISDYKTIGNLVVEDFISNGQTLVLPVMLTVSDQFGTKSGPIPSPFITQTANPQGAANFCPAVPQLQQPQNGTVLTFNVSSAMPGIPAFTVPRLAAGILTGGYAAGTSAPNNPAIGTITFHAKVEDVFQLPVAPGDKFVDKDDPMNNCVRISGKVYQNVGRPNPINFPTNIPNVVVAGANDDSNTATLLLGDTLKKTVYSVKRANAFGIYNPICGPPSGPGGTSCSNSPNPPQEVRAGDQVTYRIEKVIPSSDAENLVVEDWLPQPAYAVASINFNNAPCVGVPNPGNSCLGPTDTLHSLPVAPTVLAFPATNSINFNYGSFNDTSNLSRKIDLLFTYKVTSQPFADGLFLTNEAQECETNTFGARFCQVAIAQVNLREPNLRIRKGIIATNNPNGTFTHPGLQTANLSTAQAPPGATFTLNGISGVVNSNDLAAGLVNDDVSGVDANDIVTFAVTIENLGGAPAYDVKIQDIIPTDTSGNPTCFTLLPNPIIVKRGTGVVVPSALYSISPTSILPTTTSFTITSNPIPIPLSAYNATSGANIVVITFQAKLLANIKPGCCDNVVELTQYASVLGGPNFVGANFTPPFKDAAQVCVKPKAEKCVTATSEAHTQADNSVSGTPQPPQVAIGEIIRYHLTITLPEGVSPFFRLTDHLPPGLTYMPGTAKVAFVSTLGIATSAAGLSAAQMPDPVNYTLGCLKPNPTALLPSSLVSPGSFTAGDDPSFGLGILTNNDNDNNLEYVVIEFNALVNNVPPNFDTVTLKNNYEIFLGKVVVGQIPVAIATSNDADVIVVEPKLTMTKTVAPNPALKGQTLTYTVQYTNNGTADAFNVELRDTLPPGLTFGTITAGCPFTNVPANTLTVTCAQIPKAPNPGSTVVVSYQAVANPTKCPVILDNRANLTWTSLPGPKGTTVNQTGSSTPGNSGSSDGERDGVTPQLTLNDYAATASAGVKIDCPCEATISGLKFNDLNGNGVRDTGEPGISGWTIKITDSSGNTQTTTTNSSGNYSFTVPAPGTYTVAEVLQSGWAQTAPSTGNYSVTVSPGQIITNRNFGNRKKQGCDLQITKEVKPSPLVSGQQATVTITVKNLGTGPCHGPTQVTESMPAGLTLVSASVPGGSCVLSTGVCNYAPGIPAGGSVVFTYVFNVTAQPGTNFENCASLKNSEDQNPQNDGACVPLKVSGDKLPDLTIKKTVQCGGPAIPQGTCSVSFTISNNGPGAFNGIAVIKDLVTPTPSPGLGWAGSSTPPGWSCGIGGPGSVGCATTSSVSLVPGQSTSFSILLKVPAGQFQNCASVKGYTQFPYSASTLIQESDFNNNESCVSMGV
ncbi:MAG TPA: SdrD B-like domain-containing protein [Pyrinomonadaceae bacterium]|nr:SdrD B-like domain-containing protein [Pyrinomonadaceae bacterium]